MSRLARKIKVALAGLVGGFAFACRAAAPSEAPPMGPRPEPVQPAPEPTAPVPGAPDPTAPADAGISSAIHVEPATFAAAPAQKPKTPSDAGVPADAPLPPDAPPPSDAGLPLPPVPDGGLPPDASRRAE